MRTLLSSVLVIVVVATGCGESHGSRFDAGQPSMDAGDDRDAGRTGEDAAVVDASVGEPCDVPGTVETVSCGACGTQERFCAADGRWMNGACMGEGECIAGTLDTIACGRCGTQSARCTASCTWETTGACTGEGECAPGDRTRSGDGCTPPQTREMLCNSECAFEPAGACMADSCTTPGAVEVVPCGMCGTQERFCTAALVWDYGACGGEGVCAPGTTGSAACGMCGTRAARCTSACTWEPTGACTGEGECAPGARMRTSVGCPAGQTRVVLCNDTCTFVTDEPCTPMLPVDVTLLFDVTGSHATFVSGSRALIISDLIRPLLAITDVAVGISWYADFPVDPYGATGLGGTDRPFEGGVEPVLSETAVNTELNLGPSYRGGDGPEAGIEALSILGGGALPSSAIAVTCSPGRAAGGCWRAGAVRVIVMFTDATSHNGPDPSSTGLFSPYSGISPAPATWPSVLTQMMADGTILLVLQRGADGTASAQYVEMLTDLGQPSSDRIPSDSLAPALATVVSRVRAIAMP